MLEEEKLEIIITQTKNVQQEFTVYVVKTEKKGGEKVIIETERRFREFFTLHQELQKQFGYVFNDFPKKKLFGKMDNEVIESRKKQLQAFLNDCASHEKLRNADIFLKFLGFKGGFVSDPKASSPTTSPSTSPLRERPSDPSPVTTTTTSTTTTSSTSTSTSATSTATAIITSLKSTDEETKELQELLVEFGYGVIKHSELGPALDAGLKGASGLLPSHLSLPLPTNPPDLIEALRKWAQILMKYRKNDMSVGVQAAFLINTAAVAIEHGQKGDASTVNSNLVEIVKESIYSVFNLNSVTERREVSIWSDTFKRQREIATKLRQHIAEKSQDSLAISECCRMITDTFKQLVESMLKNYEGKPPCAWCVIAGGSMGRGEMSPYSDLEFAIIIENETHSNWFRGLNHLLELQVLSLGETAFVGDQRFPGAGAGPASSLWSMMFPNLNGVIHNGFRFDEGTTTPSASPADLITSPQRLVAALAKSTTEQGDNIIKTSLLHSTFVAGDQELFNSFSDLLKKELSQEERLKKRALALMEEFIQNFAGDRFEAEKKYQIKSEFYRIFHGIIGNLAVLNDIESSNGWEQLNGLKDKGIFSDEVYQTLVSTMNTIIQMRMRTQLFYNEECEVIYLPREEDEDEKGSVQMGNTATHFYATEEISNLLSGVYAVNFALVDAAQQMLKEQKTNQTLDFTPFKNLKFDSLEGVGISRLKMGRYREAIQTFKTIIKNLLEQAEQVEGVTDRKIQSKSARNLLGVSSLHLARSVSAERKKLVALHPNAAEAPSQVKQKLWKSQNEIEENLNEAKKIFEELLQEDTADFGDQSFEALTCHQHLATIERERGDDASSNHHFTIAIQTSKSLIAKIKAADPQQSTSKLNFVLCELLNEKVDLLLSSAAQKEQKEGAKPEDVAPLYQEAIPLALESLQSSERLDLPDLQISIIQKLIHTYEKVGDSQQSKAWKKKLIFLQDKFYGKKSQEDNEYLKVMLIEIAKEVGLFVTEVIVQHFIQVAKKMLEEEARRHLEKQEEEAKRELARKEYEAKQELERQKAQAAEAVQNLNPFKKFF